jgi:hypothetical protein
MRLLISPLSASTRPPSSVAIRRLDAVVLAASGSASVESDLAIGMHLFR